MLASKIRTIDLHNLAISFDHSVRLQELEQQPRKGPVLQSIQHLGKEYARFASAGIAGNDAIGVDV